MKYLQQPEVIELDITKRNNYNIFDKIDSNLLFCATGFRSKGIEEGFYDHINHRKIIDINYAKLVPIINYFVQKFEG